MLLTAKIKMGPGRRHSARLLSGEKMRRDVEMWVLLQVNWHSGLGILPRHTEG